jgi:hypothetical protein
MFGGKFVNYFIEPNYAFDFQLLVSLVSPFFYYIIAQLPQKEQKDIPSRSGRGFHQIRIRIFGVKA